MKLENLNGFSRVTPMDGRTYGPMSASPTTGTCREYGSGEVVTNAPLPCPKGFEQLEGYSRVNYLNGYDEDEILDGFMLSGFVLNGYMLSGHEVDDMIEYCEECDQAGEDPTMDGLRDRLRAGRARRQARRKAKKMARPRQIRVGKRRETRDIRRAQRQEKRRIKMEQMKSGDGPLAKLARSIGIGGAGLGKDMDQEGTMLEEFEVTADSDKGLFGPPQFFKDPKKWFQSKKVPTWQKGLVIVGGLVVVDQVANKGRITKKIITSKKRK